jgi:hypothetical protein
MTAPVDFYLYEADTYRWVMIHTGGCRHCNHGRGAQPKAQGLTSRWYGPYLTYEAAHAQARALHERVYPCQKCVPSAPTPAEGS